MRRFVSTGIALSTIALAGVATTAVQAQTITNSGFETPDIAAGNFQYNPAGGTWAFTGQSGISENASGFTSTQVAPQGTQVAFLQSLGSFSQTITGLTSGSTYSITFLSAQRLNAGGQTIRVSLGGAPFSTITPIGTTYASYTTSPFLVTGTSALLTFAGTNQADATAFIDNVSINFVPPVAPEPGSALLLVPGLLGLVGIVRRRSAK